MKPFWVKSGKLARKGRKIEGIILNGLVWRRASMNWRYASLNWRATRTGAPWRHSREVFKNFNQLKRVVFFDWLTVCESSDSLKNIDCKIDF